MGLDMYVYRIKRADLDPNKIHNYNDLNISGYSLYSDEDINSDYLKDIRKIANPYKVEAQYYDLEKIRNYYKLVETPSWCGLSGDTQMFHADGKIIYIEGKDIAKFTTKSVDTFWVVRMTKVAYWRAREDIQTAFYRFMGKRVENVGYYKLSPKIIKRISELGLEGFNLEHEWDKGSLYYHECY